MTRSVVSYPTRVVNSFLRQTYSDEVTMANPVKHPEFGLRFKQACDGNPDIPPVNFGRLGHFRKEFERRFGEDVTVESVRKWMADETRPREDAMRKLAEILEVEVTWLSLGESLELSKKDARLRDAMADGGVNLIAGLIQMCGWYPAFPNEKQSESHAGMIDLFAVIKGAQYSFHVVVSKIVDGKHRFHVPMRAPEHCVVIGIKWTSMADYSIYELDSERLLASGHPKTGVYDMEADAGFQTDQHVFRAFTVIGATQGVTMASPRMGACQVGTLYRCPDQTLRSLPDRTRFISSTWGRRPTTRAGRRW